MEEKWVGTVCFRHSSNTISDSKSLKLNFSRKWAHSDERKVILSLKQSFKKKVGLEIQFSGRMLTSCTGGPGLNSQNHRKNKNRKQIFLKSKKIYNVANVIRITSKQIHSLRQNNPHHTSSFWRDQSLPDYLQLEINQTTWMNPYNKVLYSQEEGNKSFLRIRK